MTGEAKQLMQELFVSYLEAASDIVGLLERYDVEVGEVGEVPQAVKARLVRAVWHDDNHRRQLEVTRHRSYPHAFDANTRGGWLNYLLASWAVERARLAAVLVNLAGPDFEIKVSEGEWTIREIVEHTIAADRMHVDHIRKVLKG